jgi:hypothetical protein
MDLPPDQHRFEADPSATSDRDLAGTDPWGLGESPEAAAVPKSTYDSRAVYLRWRNWITSSADVPAPNTSGRRTMATRVWARLQSRRPLGRRAVVGLGLFGLACVLLIGLPRYDFAPSIKTMSGTTYNTAVDRLASAVNAALDLVGQGPAAPVATQDAESISRTKAPTNKTIGKRGPINSSRAAQLIPLISAETVHANGPAPIGNATTEADEPLDLAPDGSVVDASIIYSPEDTDISPPVAIRSPGIATDRGDQDQYVLLIEILVSETGDVESARGRPRPATIGAAVQSNMALSIVKTWRFRPARKDDQPVKYRTTVRFAETMNVGRNH